MSSIPHFVYELVDPRDMSIFYVGITIDLYARYRQHMHCDGVNPQKDKRIQEILAAGHLPIMRTREYVKCYDKALERESYWIGFYLQQGVHLTNIAGVPSDMSKPVEKKPKPFSYEHLTTLYFKTEDGRIVSLTRSTNRDFQAFVLRYVALDENITLEDWGDGWRRRQVINHIYKNGVEMELFDTPLEGESKYLWIVERDPDPPEVTA